MKNLTSTHSFLALALTTLMSAGCDEVAQDEAFGEGDVSERCVNCGGGILFNTFMWGKEDGGSLDVKGAVWSNARLVSVELACPKSEKDLWRFPKECLKDTMFRLDAVRAVSGELLGKRDIFDFGGADFLGSRWTVDLYDGEKVVGTHVQNITAYAYDATQKPHALHYYTFMFYGDGANGGEKGVWTPACKESVDPITGLPVGTKAVVYDDIEVDTKTGKISERESSLYLACITGAVGKAGNWGYPAWEIGHEDFTTSVRMVRADYCGDGVSWTTIGSSLQAKDVFKYRDFSNANGATEAMWGEKGALCLGTPRWTTQYAYSDVSCNGAKLQPCGAATLTDYSEAIAWTKLP
ncbi:MAG TPA: ADYC domain-containing protein [Nannocystis sp.]